MNIVILGAPASGKGTQSELLAKKFKFFLLQTGDFSRKLAQKDERIQKIVESGKLIPQDEMTRYVLDFLKDKKKESENILFEGFPRFIRQFKELEKYLLNNKSNIDAVISIDISLQEAIKRISTRRICSKCGKIYNIITNPSNKDGICECGGSLSVRADDNPDSVKTRFDYYNKNTKELIDYLDKKGELIRVNGERPINEIQKDLVEIVKKIKKSEQTNN